MKLPKSWHDITVGKYSQIYSIIQKGLDPLDQKIEILSVLTGMSVDDILAIDLSEFTKINDQIAFIQNMNISEKLVLDYKINGYKFRANVKITEQKASQYIDIMNYLKQKDAFYLHLHDVIANISEQQVGWFKKKKITKKELSQMIYDKMPITEAYPIMVFFWNLWNNLMPDIKTYLDSQIKQMEKEVIRQKIKNRLLKDGAGS